jgi:tetratricopeptide (TPR) repeat protein
MLFASALALRLANVAFLHPTPVFRYLFIDSEYYDSVGRRLASGEGFPEGVFFMNVLYGAFLGGIYKILGTTDGGRVAALLLQCVLGSVSTVLLARLAARVGRPREGFLAGCLLAGFGPAIFYDGSLLTPSLVLFLLTFALFVSFGPNPRPFPLGLLGGVLVLSRASNVLFLPGLALPLFRRGGFSKRRLALFASGVALAVSPVTIRNFLVSRELVPVTANGGMALWAGNHDEATGIYSQPGFLTNPVPEREAEDYRAEASRRVGRELTLAESSRFWTRQTLRRVAEEPTSMARLAFRKLRVFFNATESQTNLSYYFARDYSEVLQIFRADLGWILPFSILGLWTSARSLAPLALPIAASLATCLVFYVSSEYRHPVVPSLLLFAAIGGRHAVEVLRSGTLLRRFGLVSILVALFVAALWRDPFFERLRSRRVDYLNFGTLAFLEGNLGEARDLLQRSVAIDPNWPVSRRKLAEVLARSGHVQEAVEENLRADALEGRTLDLGGRKMVEADRLFRAGRFAEAKAIFLALAADGGPESATCLNNAGLAAMRLSEAGSAESLFVASIQRDPTYASPHIHSGRLALTLGDSARAESRALEALALDSRDARAQRLLNRARGVGP